MKLTNLTNFSESMIFMESIYKNFVKLIYVFDFTSFFWPGLFKKIFHIRLYSEKNNTKKCKLYLLISLYYFAKYLHCEAPFKFFAFIYISYVGTPTFFWQNPLHCFALLKRKRGQTFQNSPQ